MRRSIRLKEWGCNESTFKRPNTLQISKSTSDLEDKNYALNTDSNGFIINSQLKNRDIRNKKIILLGDSFVESLFIDEDRRINAILENLFTNTSVLNGGHSGATSLHLLNIIINKVIPINPDYVVIFIPTNDQRIKSLENGYWNNDDRLSPLVPLGTKLKLIDEYQNDYYFLKSTEKILTLIHFTLSNFCISHCFATTPHRYKVTNNDEWLKKSCLDKKKYANKISSRKNTNNACRNFCKKHRIDIIDLELEASDSIFFYDDLHLSNKYSPFVGKILFDALNKLCIFQGVKNEY